MNLVIGPGASWIACEAADLFGSARVNPGNFAEPVTITDLSDDEVKFAEEYFRDCAKKKKCPIFIKQE